MKSKYKILESSIRELSNGHQNEVRLVENRKTGDFEVQKWIWDDPEDPQDRLFWTYRYSPYGLEEAKKDYKHSVFYVVTLHGPKFKHQKES